MYKRKIENGKVDPRSIWKLFREVGAGSKAGPQETVPGIYVKDHFVSSEFDIANVFNNYFAKVASHLKEPVQSCDFNLLKEYVDSKVPVNDLFSIPMLNITFVKKFLTNLDVTKATVLDCIGPRLLKIGTDALCSSITNIINKSLSQGVCPALWKTAKVNPFF